MAFCIFFMPPRTRPFTTLFVHYVILAYRLCRLRGRLFTRNNEPLQQMLYRAQRIGYWACYRSLGLRNSCCSLASATSSSEGQARGTNVSLADDNVQLRNCYQGAPASGCQDRRSRVADHHSGTRVSKVTLRFAWCLLEVGMFVSYSSV